MKYKSLRNVSHIILMIFDFISNNLPRIKRGFSAIRKQKYFYLEQCLPQQILLFDLKKNVLALWRASSGLDRQLLTTDFTVSFGTAAEKTKKTSFGHCISLSLQEIRSIEGTRGFPQHKCLQTFVFICNLFEVLDLLLLIASIVQLFVSEQPQYIFLLISTIILIVIQVLSRAGPLADACGKSLLKKKIIKSIQDCNVEYLNPLGYSAQFPEVTKRFCLCIRCCDCLFRKKLIDRIDIYQIQEM